MHIVVRSWRKRTLCSFVINRQDDSTVGFFFLWNKKKKNNIVEGENKHFILLNDKNVKTWSQGSNLQLDYGIFNILYIPPFFKDRHIRVILFFYVFMKGVRFFIIFYKLYTVPILIKATQIHSQINRYSFSWIFLQKRIPLSLIYFLWGPQGPRKQYWFFVNTFRTSD